MALRNLNRSNIMIEDILDIISIEAGAGVNLVFDQFDYSEVLGSICKEADLVYPEKVECEIGCESIPGVFDQSGFRRVIENLISNAIKYGKRGSPIQIGLADEGEYVSVSVSNLGDPIPESDKQTIFEFLKRSGSRATTGRSWGLGLSIVKIIVEAHQGAVEVQSTEDETRFTVRFKKIAGPEGEQNAVLFK